MNPPSHIVATLARLRQLNRDLRELTSSSFVDAFDQARTAAGLYEIALAYGYAVNGRELRDTDDARIHKVLDDISDRFAELHAIFRAKLFPASPRQRQEWEKTVLPAPGGKYAFSKADGSLTVSLLDAALHASTLHVKRIWTGVCNYDGSRTDFAIELDGRQVAFLQSRFAELGCVQPALDGLREAAR